ncbi:DUF551 domain-containing protein [Klebsiella quasipneumoniae]|uniref:DUF551 domain-containing protein n=1 Tax=Klebsiella quasipneumoniae TaxID=1463165 RepID=UPI0029D4BFB3|nr:DUF551 domain-containing protein [Klebsiella quasipneumoniae]MDX7657564.1 DUF551 domain-containing protein [Klebsiella quasipneumoniae]
MTKSTITREESIQAVFDLKVGYPLGLADIEILKRVARMALAAMDSEPVAEVVSIYGDPEAFGGREIRPLVGIQQMPYGTKLYRHVQQPVVESDPVALQPELAKVIYHFRDWNEGFPVERFKADYVISWMLANYPPAPPAPVVSSDLLHTAASAIEDLLTTKDRTGAGVWFDLPFRLRSAANAQPAPVAPVCTCPSGDGSLRWPCPVHTGNSPVIPDGWTGNEKANAALMMLDRIETVDPVDDDRIDGIKRIVRELAAAPHDTPALNSVQSVVTVPGKWIPVSERMPDDDDFVYIWPRPDFGVELHVGQYCECSPKGDGWYAQVYEQNYGIEWHPITVTHWMPLPAAPQEVNRE